MRARIYCDDGLHLVLLFIGLKLVAAIPYRQLEEYGLYIELNQKGRANDSR